jgi:Sulfotransferase family
MQTKIKRAPQLAIAPTFAEAPVLHRMPERKHSSTARLRPPIFLIGNYRSGTTITQKLIGIHPDIITWYEPRTLWMYADPGRRHDEFDEQDATDKVVRYVRKRFLRFQRKHGDRRIMENTPSNVMRVPYVDRIFPECTFLYITRNPFSCVNSTDTKWNQPKSWSGLMRTLADTPPSQLHYYAGAFFQHAVVKRIRRDNKSAIYGPRYKGIYQDLNDSSRLKIIARMWARGNRMAREALARLGEGRTLTFRYEDLVRNPGGTVQRIYEHCGLSCNAQIIDAARHMVDPGHQEKWLRLNPEELRTIIPEVEDEMAQYGYEIPEPLR